MANNVTKSLQVAGDVIQSSDTLKRAGMTPERAVGILKDRLGEPSIRAGLNGYSPAEIAGHLHAAVSSANTATTPSTINVGLPEGVRNVLGGLELSTIRDPARRLGVYQNAVAEAAKRAGASNESMPHGAADDPAISKLQDHFAEQATADRVLGKSVPPQPTFAPLPAGMSPEKKLTVGLLRNQAARDLREWQDAKVALASPTLPAHLSHIARRRVSEYAAKLKAAGVVAEGL